MSLIWMSLCLLLIVIALVWISGWSRKRSAREQSEDWALIRGFRPKRQIDVDSSLLLQASPAPQGARAAYLLIDTETTGLGEDNAQWQAHWQAPKPVAIAWQVLDADLNLIEESSYLIRRDDPIEEQAEAIHHISQADLLEHGEEASYVYQALLGRARESQILIAHNLPFHRTVIEQDMQFWGIDPSDLAKLQGFCTMHGGIDYTHLTDANGNWKLPRLSELFGMLYFGKRHIQCSFSKKYIHDIRLLRACLKRMHLPLEVEA